MFSHKHFLTKATCALLLCPWLAASTFAQSTFGAAQPANNFLNSDFVLNFALLTLSLGLCGSLFWWRREKTATGKPSARRAPTDRHLRPTLSEDKKTRVSPGRTNQPKNDSVEIDARFAAWVQANVNAKPNVSSQTANQTAVENKPNTAAAAPVPKFELPAALPPLESLPFSGDASLLEAIEQSQDFDADETTREIAVLELAEHKTSNAIEALAQIALYDECSRLRINALQALGNFDHESAFEPILLGCIDVAREVRAAAARTLSRLSFDRGTAFNRIVENNDQESLRLSAMACVDAGLVVHAFNRLTHQDSKHANEAFAMIRLLVAAGDFAPIINVINTHADLSIRLATIEAVKTLEPANISKEFLDLTVNEKLPNEVLQSLNELFEQTATV